jgi:hypothetical protein
MAHGQVRGTGRIPEDQGVVESIGIEEIASVGAPTRRVRHCESPEIRERAQPPGHPLDLRALLTLRVQEVLLHHGGDRVPRGVRRVVDRNLSVQRLRGEPDDHDKPEQTSHGWPPRSFKERYG